MERDSCPSLKLRWKIRERSIIRPRSSNLASKSRRRNNYVPSLYLTNIGVWSRKFLPSFISAIYRVQKFEFNLSLHLNILCPISGPTTLARAHVYLAKRNALFPKIFHLFPCQHHVISVKEIEETALVQRCWWINEIFFLPCNMTFLSNFICCIN